MHKQHSQKQPSRNNRNRNHNNYIINHKNSKAITNKHPNHNASNTLKPKPTIKLLNPNNKTISKDSHQIYQTSKVNQNTNTIKQSAIPKPTNYKHI